MPTIQLIRIFLAILIVIGIVLLCTQSFWLQPLVSSILAKEDLPTSYATSTSNVHNIDHKRGSTSKSVISTRESLAVQSLSSTSQVGQFTVVVNCKVSNPVSVEILKNASVIQRLGMEASITGLSQCVKPKFQDINFDGYADIMVPNADGSGGASYAYWLYNPNTQHFYCSSKDNDCNLMNPEFNSATKIVKSINLLGSGTTETKTYNIVNGNLNLVSDVTSNT